MSVYDTDEDRRIIHMTPEFKKLWLTKLRSGEYTQTKQHLKDDKGYCCLGVALECAGIKFDGTAINAPQGVGCIDGYLPAAQPDEDGHEHPLNSGNELSYAGRKLIGITLAQHDKLTDLNDNSDDFEKVAEWIEDNL